MRLHFVLAFLMLVLAGGALAAEHAIPVTGGQTVMTHETRSGGDLSFHVELGALQAIDVNTKAGDFSRLLLPGFHTSQQVGHPELPMMNRLINVPAGAEADIVIEDVRTRTVRLADYGIDNRLMPHQPSVSKSADLSKLEFHYNQAAYGVDVAKAAAEVVSVVDLGTMRAMDMARLEIAPVQYRPVSGELVITESIDFRVVFRGADQKAAADRYAAYASPFFNHLYDQVAGGEVAKIFQDDYPDRVADQVKMVIVTPPSFASQLNDFVQWKTDRGFEVIMAVTGTPEVGSTTSSIQSYLHGLYNAATPEDPAPSFVIFVGDVAQMPTFTLNGNATDRPYCAVDGDLVPDMYYGRMSCTNPSQLQAILDKTMMYDQFTMPDPSYEHYFNAAHGITSHAYLYPASNGPVESELIGLYNDGVGFINYTAHGSQTSWADPDMSQSDINNLTNYGKYFTAIGNCCLTGTYNYGECFGETFLRADYWWGVGFHSSSQINGTAWPIESTGLGAYDSLFHENGQNENLHYVTNGGILFAGNLAVMESGSSRITYYWNIYNLMGDPSISTFLGVPEENDVTLPGAIYSSAQSVSVQADAGSYVGLTQNGVLVGSGTVDASGNLEVALSAPLTPGTPLKVVVMAQNREPYIVELPVAVPAQITITPETFPANTNTSISVSVLENDGVTPKPNVDIWVEWAFGELTSVMSTDANGELEFTLNVPYGCELTMVGREAGVEYNLFTRPLTVTASDLVEPDLMVATEMGLTDVFAMNLNSELTGVCGTAGAEVVALLPDGTLLDENDMDLDILPTTGGQITAFIRVEGSNLYSETFDILTTGSIRGRVDLLANGDDSGCVITAQPGGASVVTDADGMYHLTGLDAGTYTLTAVMPGYATTENVVTLAEGQHVADVNFSMPRVYVLDVCDAPSLSIPDGETSGVSTSINVSLDKELTSIKVDLDLTHTYVGDLIVRLTSPAGTTVTLHDRSGGSNDNIVGTYPDGLTPAESLDAFLGENMQGDWTLFVSDNAGWDTGTINEWCLHLGYPDDLSAVDDPTVPTVLALKGNYPNPFNPMTKISFDLPRSTQVRLEVFDIRGHKVSTLVQEPMSAGRHAVVWNGTDEGGRQMASGTYFYRLVADGTVMTDKMLLLK